MGPELVKKERTAGQSDLIAEAEKYEFPEDCEEWEDDMCCDFCDGTGYCEELLSTCPKCMGEGIPLWRL
jgi:DnaJ-class molecular chaperone